MLLYDEYLDGQSDVVKLVQGDPVWNDGLVEMVGVVFVALGVNKNC